MPLFRQQTAAVRSETISPIRNASFNKGGSARVRKQGGTPVQGPANVARGSGSLQQLRKTHWGVGWAQRNQKLLLYRDSFEDALQGSLS